MVNSELSMKAMDWSRRIPIVRIFTPTGTYLLPQVVRRNKHCNLPVLNGKYLVNLDTNPEN